MLSMNLTKFQFGNVLTNISHAYDFQNKDKFTVQSTNETKSELARKDGGKLYG